MLIELRKLNIENTGYKRVITIDKIYVNESHIVSISGYQKIKDFLILEKEISYSETDFSLVKINSGKNICLQGNTDISSPFLNSV